MIGPRSAGTEAESARDGRSARFCYFSAVARPSDSRIQPLAPPSRRRLLTHAPLRSLPNHPQQPTLNAIRPYRDGERPRRSPKLAPEAARPARWPTPSPRRSAAAVGPQRTRPSPSTLTPRSPRGPQTPTTRTSGPPRAGPAGPGAASQSPRRCRLKVSSIPFFPLLLPILARDRERRIFRPHLSPRSASAARFYPTRSRL